MLRRLLIGMLKGLLIGGAVGAALHFGLGQTSIASALNYPLYGLVGALAGIFAGRPPWHEGARVATILKGVFGLLLGFGLYALAAAFLKGAFPIALPNVPATANFAQIPLVFAPSVAALYAALVEIDDGGENPEPAARSGTRINLDDIKVDEEEAPAAKPAAKQAQARRKG